MTSQKKQFGCLSSLFGVLITFGITIVLLGTYPSERLVRSIGGCLQFFGILTVAWGIRDLRIEFKVPTWREGLRSELSLLWENVKGHWRQVTRRRTDPRIATGSGTLTMSGSATVSTSGRLSAKRLPPDRLSMVVDELESVKAELLAANEELARHRESVIRDLATEAEHRAEVEAQLTSMITSLAVGGLRLETVGICWLFAGIALTTWPCEIARWLGASC